MKLAELASRLGGAVDGDPEIEITGVAGLEEAGAGDVSFLSNRRYAALFRDSKAGAVLVSRHEATHGKTVVRCDDPYLAFARALEIFHPRPAFRAEVDPRAVALGKVDGARLMPFAYVGEGAAVGEGTLLQPFVYVGAGAQVGRDCVLMAGSVVMDGCVVGDRVVLNPGAVVGGEGFGFVPTREGLVKIPQAGRAVVQDDVEIGANSCVDRAAMGDTVVGRGTKTDNLVQVGHAAEIGPHNVMVAYSGVAGSTRTGAGVTLAARATVLGHLDVGSGVTVGAMSMVTNDVPSGEKRSGIPAIEHREWLRVATLLKELPELFKRVKKLEERD
ncbi:MAG: UDP-3-O-(3-hydroxymyristoyl)glucosamine N-acyltransferase [Deltaproteobacteria bacterium]|nr:UDP-3-O-(3-hydroxymyristoyl)glucosamine N-acyltransferase [Deltaproteobacteria bacterium]